MVSLPALVIQILGKVEIYKKLIPSTCVFTRSLGYSVCGRNVDLEFLPSKSFLRSFPKKDLK